MASRLQFGSAGQGEAKHEAGLTDASFQQTMSSSNEVAGCTTMTGKTSATLIIWLYYCHTLNAHKLAEYLSAVS